MCSTNDIDNQLIRGAFQVSQCLVWALPLPWGPIGAGVLTIADILWEGQQLANNPYQVVIDELQEFSQQQEIAAWVRAMQELVDWMREQQYVLQEIRGCETEYIQQNLLPALREQTRPGNKNILDAITGLMEDQYVEKKGVLEILVSGIAVYLLAKKMIIQLDALVASNYADQGLDRANEFNNLWRGDYDSYVIDIMGKGLLKGWADKLEALLPKLKVSRLSKISDVHQYQYWTEGPNPIPALKTLHNGWTFVDSWTRDTETTHFIEDYTRLIPLIPVRPVEGPLGGPMGPILPVTADPQTIKSVIETQFSQTASNSAHDVYVNQISSQFDKQCSDTRLVITKWKDSINDWNSHLPPLAPQEVVRVNSDGWKAAVPQGNEWVKGNAVRYAVAFANTSGPSPMGHWSEWTPIEDKAFPTLVLPVDQTGMAAARWVYRQFESNTDKSRIVGIVPNNTETKYQDQHP